MAGNDGGQSAAHAPWVSTWRQLGWVEAAVPWILAIFAVTIVVFSFTSLFQTPADGPQVSASCRCSLSGVLDGFVVSLSVCMAALITGGLLGFLFGIPKSLQRALVAAPSGGDAVKTGPSYTDNTSFEEISDWLTKIIVGLSLVEFERVLQAIYWAALMSASFVAHEPIPAGSLTDWAKAGNPIAVPYFYALIVAALITGLFFMYIETRTRLALLFSDTKRVLDHGLPPGGPIAEPKAGSGDGKGPLQPTAATSDDERIAAIPRASLTTASDLTRWAIAQARKRNYGLAVEALLDALMKDSMSIPIRLRLAEVLRLQEKDADAYRYEMQAADLEPDVRKRAAILRNALLSALYAEPPVGFTQAIDITGRLLAMESERSDAWVWVWRACGFGQKFRYLLQTNASQAERDEAQREAFDAVKAAVAAAPDYMSDSRALMRELLDPVAEGTDLTENDLEAFKDVREFRALIYSGKPTADAEGRKTAAAGTADRAQAEAEQEVRDAEAEARIIAAAATSEEKPRS